MKLKQGVCLLMAGALLVGTVLSGCGKDEKSTSRKIYRPEDAEVLEDNDLTGMNIAYLGSSVMQGTENDNVSFAEFIAKRNEGTYIKETKENTTIADTGEDSYIQRLKKIDPNAKIDFFLCEIPWADVEQEVPAGKASDGADLEELDTKTSIGAMEYIARYAKQTWNCPVAFFTSPRIQDDEAYYELVQAAWSNKGQWQSSTVCFWVEVPLTDEEIEEYMVDARHPSGKGYLEYFSPLIEKKMMKALHESRQYAINSEPAYEVEAVAEREPNVLNGKHIIYLGSSVTYGSASNQLTFADYIGKRDKTTFVKEAVSGTTLVDNGETSYVQRMVNRIDPNQHADLFVCQLSTNDASTKNPLGEISDSKNLQDFDTSTVIGAIEYIITYAQQTWNCPVMFYTGTKYDSEQYGKMVEVLKQLQQKYEFGIINMWDELNADIPEYDSYMSDGIHPNRKGYLEWWTPFMEEKMIEYLKSFPE